MKKGKKEAPAPKNNESGEGQAKDISKGVLYMLNSHLDQCKNK